MFLVYVDVFSRLILFSFDFICCCFVVYLNYGVDQTESLWVSQFASCHKPLRQHKCVYFSLAVMIHNKTLFREATLPAATLCHLVFLFGFYYY